MVGVGGAVVCVVATLWVAERKQTDRWRCIRSHRPPTFSCAPLPVHPSTNHTYHSSMDEQMVQGLNNVGRTNKWSWCIQFVGGGSHMLHHACYLQGLWVGIHVFEPVSLSYGFAEALPIFAEADVLTRFQRGHF